MKQVGRRRLLLHYSDQLDKSEAYKNSKKAEEAANGEDEVGLPLDEDHRQRMMEDPEIGRTTKTPHSLAVRTRITRYA